MLNIDGTEHLYELKDIRHFDFFYNRLAQKSINSDNFLRPWFCLGVAAPPPRFRKSSLRSRPSGFNRITHTASYGTNLWLDPWLAFHLDLSFRHWRTLAYNRLLPFIMPFEEDLPLVWTICFIASTWGDFFFCASLRRASLHRCSATAVGDYFTVLGYSHSRLVVAAKYALQVTSAIILSWARFARNFTCKHARNTLWYSLSKVKSYRAIAKQAGDLLQNFL